MQETRGHRKSSKPGSLVSATASCTESRICDSRLPPLGHSPLWQTDGPRTTRHAGTPQRRRTSERTPLPRRHTRSVIQLSTTNENVRPQSRECSALGVTASGSRPAQRKPIIIIETPRKLRQPLSPRIMNFNGYANGIMTTKLGDHVEVLANGKQQELARSLESGTKSSNSVCSSAYNKSSVTSYRRAPRLVKGIAEISTNSTTGKAELVVLIPSSKQKPCAQRTADTGNKVLTSCPSSGRENRLEKSGVKGSPLNGAYRGLLKARVKNDAKVMPKKETEGLLEIPRCSNDKLGGEFLEGLEYSVRRLDISCEYLNDSKERRAKTSTKNVVSQTATIQDLLKECGLREPETFHCYFGKELFGAQKIGEATFSEVFLLAFRGQRVVAKIIPFGRGSDVPVNGESQQSAHDVYQEAKHTRIMSQLHGFGKLVDLAVVSGEYPEGLLEAWDTYNNAHRSENERPDYFDAEQKYLVLLLEYGGVDLEHAKLRNWKEACSVAYQVCLSIANAERNLEFEHRDLHWGNILVDRIQSTSQEGTGVDLHGVKCTIIDYTLSRLVLGGNTYFVKLDDESYFTGEGDYQFEVYRRMREETKGDWRSHWPKTNVYWLHYLLDKLLTAKSPTRDKNKRAKGELQGLFARLEDYPSGLRVFDEDQFFAWFVAGCE